MKPLDNPLSLLPDENSADGGAAPAATRFSVSNPDIESIDPGERAAAGAMLAGSSILGRLGQIGAGIILGGLTEAGSVSATPQTALFGVKNIESLRDGSHVQRKVGIGGFRVDPMFDGMMNPARAQASVAHVSKLDEIGKTVDSFIDKYDLTRKGVSMEFSPGILQSPGYHKPTKTVALPIVSKEIALHELGHAADYSTRVGKVRAFVEPVVSKMSRVAIPLALVAGDEISRVIPGSVDDKAIQFVQRNAVGLTAATIAATSLYPEAKASILAVRHIAKTEGRDAALKAMTRLGPAFSTYLVGSIPAIVGVALAKRYMDEARKENVTLVDKVKRQLDELEGGEAGVQKVAGLGDVITDHKLYLGYLKNIGRQISSQAKESVKGPDRVKRFLGTARDVATSPSAIFGATATAVPATMAALYLYGTESGKLIRDKIDPADHNMIAGGTQGAVGNRTSESWKEQNPVKFSALVGLGAAVSSGIISKLMTDVGRVV